MDAAEAWARVTVVVVSHFALAVIRPCLEAPARLGLVVDLATTRDIGSLYLNRVGWSMAVERLALPRRVRRVLRRIVPILAYPWDSVEGRGSCYCVVLRQPAEPLQAPGPSAASSGG